MIWFTIVGRMVPSKWHHQPELGTYSQEKENEKTNHWCKVSVFDDKNKQYHVINQSWKTINNSIYSIQNALKNIT